MGDMAEMMLDGFLDENGEVIDGSAPGYPRSSNYGKDHKKGLHMWLEKNVKGYKREEIDKMCQQFVDTCKIEMKGTLTETASANFAAFTNFIKTVYAKNKGN